MTMWSSIIFWKIVIVEDFYRVASSGELHQKPHQVSSLAESGSWLCYHGCRISHSAQLNILIFHSPSVWCLLIYSDFARP